MGCCTSGPRLRTKMTSEEFNERYPKPWTWYVNKTMMYLRAANGAKLGRFYLDNPKGTPQAEYNQHVVRALATEPTSCIRENDFE